MLDENEDGGAPKTMAEPGGGETACWNLMGFRVLPLQTPFELIQFSQPITEQFVI